jgi:hypothetical protein
MLPVHLINIACIFSAPLLWLWPVTWGSDVEFLQLHCHVSAQKVSDLGIFRDSHPVQEYTGSLEWKCYGYSDFLASMRFWELWTECGRSGGDETVHACGRPSYQWSLGLFLPVLDPEASTSNLVFCLFPSSIWLFIESVVIMARIFS